jgi:hypothetical protein
MLCYHFGKCVVLVFVVMVVAQQVFADPLGHAWTEVCERTHDADREDDYRLVEQSASCTYEGKAGPSTEELVAGGCLGIVGVL